MPHQSKTKRRRASQDILDGLREIAEALEQGVPLAERFTIRTVQVPEPAVYSPAAVKKLRAEMRMSQAVFAQALGVSRVWVQAWERGARQPSPLARRLMDTIRNDPTHWLTTVWAKAS